MDSPDVMALLLEARSAWVERDLHRARDLIEKVMDLDPAGEILAKARLLAGVIFQQLGDTYLSVEHLQALVNGWDDYPESRTLLEGMAWYNLGLTLYQRRLFEASLEAHERAEKHFRRESMHDHLRMCLQWQAWLLTTFHRTGQALMVLQAAEPFCTDEDARVRQHLCYAHAALVDRPTDALELAVDLAKRTDRPDVLCYLAWIAGRAQLTLGFTNEALHLAEAAIQAAVDAADMRCLSDAQRLKREIVERLNLGA